MSLEPLNNDQKLLRKLSRRRKREHRDAQRDWFSGGQRGRIEQLECRVLLSASLNVTTQPPSTITAGQPFGLAVTVENADGTVNTSYNGSVTVGDGNGYTLGGTLSVNAINGVATFSGLTEDTAGANTWTPTPAGCRPLTRAILRSRRHRRRSCPTPSLPVSSPMRRSARRLLPKTSSATSTRHLAVT